jgi:hypothetical protein
VQHYFRYCVATKASYHWPAGIWPPGTLHVFLRISRIFYGLANDILVALYTSFSWRAVVRPIGEVPGTTTCRQE